MFFVAQPHEYLAITGSGISTVKIAKKSWIWPLQRVQRFSVQPNDYSMSLQAMTKEKLQFLLPAVFTIGPDVNSRGANAKGFRGADHADDEGVNQEDQGDALVKYAMLLTDAESAKDQQHTHVESIVKGVIEGETRVLVSSMTMEEIFNEREEFKRRIYRNIQSELNQFGLRIYNANVKELKDAPNSNYFQSLAQKAHEGATQTARVDVSEARLRGAVGEAQRQGEQDQQIAKIHADTAVRKTEREIEEATAKSKLARERALLNQDVEKARIQAQRATEAQDEDLKRDVETRRAAAELERLRAKDVVKATVSREAEQHASDARAYATKQEAEAAQVRAQRETDALGYQTRSIADADAYARVKKAEAELEGKMKEAEAVASMAKAYGEMSAVMGGPEGLLRWLMIEKGTMVELAKTNAEGIRGLEPKISVWNTGTGGEGQNDPMAPVRNVYQMMPPLMSTIHDQTGIRMPEWQFGSMPPSATQQQQQQGGKGGKAGVNGV